MDPIRFQIRRTWAAVARAPPGTSDSMLSTSSGSCSDARSSAQPRLPSPNTQRARRNYHNKADVLTTRCTSSGRSDVCSSAQPRSPSPAQQFGTQPQRSAAGGASPSSTEVRQSSWFSVLLGISSSVQWVSAGGHTPFRVLPFQLTTRSVYPHRRTRASPRSFRAPASSWWRRRRRRPASP